MINRNEMLKRSKANLELCKSCKNGAEFAEKILEKNLEFSKKSSKAYVKHCAWTIWRQYRRALRKFGKDIKHCYIIHHDYTIYMKYYNCGFRPIMCSKNKDLMGFYYFGI